MNRRTSQMIAKQRIIVLEFFLLSSIISCCHGGEIMFQLNQGQQLSDWEHLLSPKGIFKLGFFSPSSSSYRYLGIWYSKLPHNPEAVWVGNPNFPIVNSSGVLVLDSDGRLKITQNGSETIVVSSNPPGQGNVILNLLDSGNLLLREVGLDGSAAGRVLWQSFDYPSSTLLPGVKLGFDSGTGQNWTITSWLSNQDPAPGSFRLVVDPGETNQLVVWRRDEVYWTSGEWQNGKFQTAPELTSKTDLFDFNFVSDGDGNKFFSFSAKNNSTLSRWEINLWGQIVQSVLDSDGQTWQYSATSSCNSNGNYSNAICIDQKPSGCRNGSELFVPQRGYYNNGELLFSDHNSSLTISDCHSMCWNNCSCVAFGSLFKDGTGCEFWSRGATFVKNDNFDVLYVLALTNPKEQGTRSSSHSGVQKLWWVLFIVAVVVAVLLTYLLYSRLRSRRGKLFEQIGNLEAKNTNSMKPQMMPSRTFNRSSKHGFDQKKGGEFQLYSFAQVEAATDYFSSTNKLGEGGFGPVYKGVMLDGQQIAVKRLARNSGQGVEEFMNEITLIAELQHTNLVKLLGCCIQGDENMLIYEYMPNKSLDLFLFDPVKRKGLYWEKRLEIIEGIAQGLLYLHKYSRLKVIHRDLKASNILLDDEMNPKISDFGMARIFGQNESRANTNRIVGTYGYMSPEYAMKGIFSVKSDVFSFGVLMLEIVSGRKNTVFTTAPVPIGLIERAWELWNRDEISELLDPSLDTPSPKDQLPIRVIHVSLLCVQESPADRPTMSEVIPMLTNTNIVLPEPKQPAYCVGKYGTGESSSGGHYSFNDVSITVMEAR